MEQHNHEETEKMKIRKKALWSLFGAISVAFVAFKSAYNSNQFLIAVFWGAATGFLFGSIFSPSSSQLGRKAKIAYWSLAFASIFLMFRVGKSVTLESSIYAALIGGTFGLLIGLLIYVFQQKRGDANPTSQPTER